MIFHNVYLFLKCFDFFEFFSNLLRRTAQNFALFSLSRPFFLLFLSLGVFSWNFGGVFEGGTLKCVRLKWYACQEALTSPPTAERCKIASPLRWNATARHSSKRTPPAVIVSPHQSKCLRKAFSERRRRRQPQQLHGRQHNIHINNTCASQRSICVNFFLIVAELVPSTGRSHLGRRFQQKYPALQEQTSVPHFKLLSVAHLVGPGGMGWRTAAGLFCYHTPVGSGWPSGTASIGYANRKRKKQPASREKS